MGAATMDIPARDEEHRVWQTYARSYDRILPILPFYQEVVSRHVSALSKPGIRRVIDVGAGTGNVAIKLATNGLDVVAMDNCREMLDQLRNKTRVDIPGVVTMVEHDAASLSAWTDATFDGATVLLALFAMRQARRALMEIIRVVRPGGLLVVTETKKQFQLQPLLDFVAEFLLNEGLYESFREDWDRVRNANVRLDPGRREARLSAEEIEQTLRQSGFRITDVKDSHLGQCETIWAEKAVSKP
jgi:ubiquinone/menaquinone biosynthesis C-methylase UbiE